MEVILKQDVSGLGYKNDIVKVKAGFGNNYLIPNGFALIANDSNKRLDSGKCSPGCAQGCKG